MNSDLTPRVFVIMGSDSDFPVMEAAGEALEAFEVPYEFKIVSAHRTPDEMWEFAKSARNNGAQVIIAGAGGAAHLPGMVASLTTLPVIGVPVSLQALNGQDSLLSIVQMPKGVPVATVAIDNAYNAGILAARILSAGVGPESEHLQKKLSEYQEKLRDTVLAKKLPLKK